jgi:histidinol-phosphatase (PHP family)
MQPKPHSDNHSHIILARIESMADAAVRSRVNTLCTTEHISQFDLARLEVEFASVHNSGRMFSTFDEYLQEFEKVKNREGLTVKKGLEVDFIGDYAKQIGSLVSQKNWDILLCSVHELPGGIDLEDSRKLSANFKSPEERWRAYIETQKRAVRSDFIPFHVLTHPVRLGLTTPSVPDDLDGMLYDLARTAREKGKALELNGADLTRSPQLVRRVAEACRRASCRVSYGSDAHFPDQVSRNYGRATELVEEFNLELIR